MSRRYDLLIFDFDGTLADSFDWFCGAINEAAVRYRFRQVAESEYEQLRQKGSRELFQELGVRWWQIPFLVRYMRQHMKGQLGRIDLFPEIAEILTELHEKGLQLAVLSSNRQDNIEATLGESGRLMVAYEGDVSLLGKGKRLKRMVRQLGVPIERAIYIGDEIRDVEAARQIGMAVAAVGWGYNSVKILEKYQPTFLLERVEELFELGK